MARSVFISHSVEDKAEAGRICAALEAQGIQCWIAPRNIEPGDPWAASIVKALADAKVMLILLSAQSNVSHQIPREIELADARQVPVLTVRLEDVEPTGALEYYLRNRHWVDVFRNPDSLEDEVVRAVKRRLGVEAPAAAASPLQPRKKNWRLALWGGGAAIGAAVMGIYLWTSFERPGERPGNPLPNPNKAADPGPAKAAEPAPTKPAIGPEAIFENSKASVVRIHMDAGGYGSAFFVTAEGHLLTADYCVKGQGPFRITTHDGTSLMAELVGVSDESKLAVVRVRPTARIQPLTIRGAPPAPDENVLVVGTTADELITYEQGVVRATEGKMIAAAFARFATAGLGGGPVIDEQGKVAGVYYQRLMAASASGGSVRLFLPASAAIVVLRSFGVWVKAS